MQADHQPPQIVRIDAQGIGYDKSGQGFFRVIAGQDAWQNGSYSIIITYTIPKPAK